MAAPPPPPYHGGKVAEMNQAITSNAHVQRANAAMSPGMQSSLFDCCSDPVGFLMSYCCGCCVAGFSAARLDDRECTLFDCYTNDYQTRQALRSKYNLGYAPLPDCLSLSCCQPCFIMQTAKEVALKKGDAPVYFGEVGMNLMGGR